MKRKMRITETEIARKTVESDGYVYCYTLIKRESTRMPLYQVPLYSIKIDLTDFGGNTTSAISDDLFSDLGKAVVFYECLVRNLATPENLAYVVEDEIAR